jgi:sugar phosphate isomerase/epimerase
MAIPISVQLYTVRDAMQNDFEGTLEQIAKMGYEYVEFAGLYNREPAQVKKLLEKLGLKASSSHAGCDDMPTNFDKHIADAKTLGYQFIVCPYLSDAWRSPEGYRKAAKVLNEAGKKAQAQGIQVCYHNHSFEFEKLSDAPGSANGMQILYGPGGLDPKLVHAELDVYWVRHGNDDPVAWIEKLAGRVPLLHIKDMDNTPQRGFAEVGTGVIDMKPIVAAAKKAGVKYLVIEQDANFKKDSLDSVKVSLNNFKKVAV